MNISNNLSFPPADILNGWGPSSHVSHSISKPIQTIHVYRQAVDIQGVPIGVLRVGRFHLLGINKLSKLQI